MTDIASWVATIATIFAACLTASNLGTRVTGAGFVVFTIGSIGWFALGLLTGQPALIWTNAVMTVLNLFGVWRWLGRQAKVEQGAERASTKSASLDSETLFPASRLTSAALAGKDGAPLGKLVDAMVGCSNGRIAYLVVAEGGVAGVGETLRRIDWGRVKIADDAVTADVDQSQFVRLTELRPGDWPGR